MKRLKCCEDCGRILIDRDEMHARTCAVCAARLDRWFTDAITSIAVAVIGVPSSALRATERREAS